MAELLSAITEQPNFPFEDLDQTNAEFLSLMLANAQLLRNGHTIAERAYPIFLGTHKPLAVAADNIFCDADKTQAVNFGIQAFEAITLFVSAQPVQPALTALEHNINGIVKPINANGAREYFEEAHQVFTESMPRTASVIRDSSERFVGSSVLAVLGGAIARQFELDNIEE